jgi:hypothetical protein
MPSKRLKMTHDTSVTNSQWWDILPSKLINIWKSGGRVRYQDDMEQLWQDGWSMYDWHVLQQHGIIVESDRTESDTVVERVIGIVISTIEPFTFQSM